MTQTIGEEIEQFRAALDGPMIAPGDAPARHRQR